MMELERLKELKQQQVRDNHRKQLQKLVKQKIRIIN